MAPSNNDKAVSARGLHGLACRRSSLRHQRHSQLNDILWRSFKRAKVPAVKEPPGLSRDDGKRPDSVTLLPWAKGKPLAWDVTVPDTYADSHLADTATTAGAAAGQQPHLRSSCHRDSRDLEQPSSGIGAGAGPTNDSRH